MKIPFDIKYKPQIESGEYKVVTRKGETVRIERWDGKDDANPIDAFIWHNDEWNGPWHWHNNGLYKTVKSEDDFDLFIITPEPELAESEDERIRKEIIEFIQNTIIKRGIKDGNDRAVKWIAYLEKQKEEEGYEAIPIENTLEYKAGFHAGREFEKQKEQKPNFDTHWENGSMVCEQKEQKPVECIPDSVKFDEGFKTGREIGFHEGVESVKPVEWSEEDEDKLKQCIRIVTGWEADYDIVHSPYSNFLKSLRPSWKPSEQEKGALRTAIHILTDERSFPKAAAQLQNILNAFEGKESRKDWKPSEEQIHAIVEALKYLPNNKDEWRILDTLVDVFKKLM